MPHFVFRQSTVSLTLALALTSLYAVEVRADIPPPDGCTPAASVGDACNNAGPANDAPGVCTASKCSRTVPGRDGGAPTTMEYDCTLCKATEGTAGASGVAGKGGKDDSDDDGGCSMNGQARSGGLFAILMAAAGFALLRRSRAGEKGAGTRRDTSK